MRAAKHPSIKKLASVKKELLPFFDPVERCLIEACQELVEASEIE